MPDAATVLAETRRELARLPPVLDALMGGLNDAVRRARPALAQWAPVEIVCHLRDEEAEDFPARLRVGLESGPTFAPVGPDRWAPLRAGYANPTPYPPPKEPVA